VSRLPLVSGSAPDQHQGVHHLQQQPERPDQHAEPLKQTHTVLPTVTHPLEHATQEKRVARENASSSTLQLTAHHPLPRLSFDEWEFPHQPVRDVLAIIVTQKNTHYNRRVLLYS